MKPEIYQVMFANQDSYWLHRGFYKIMDVFIKRNLKDNDNKILDAGCGPGGNFALLSKYGKLFAVDASEHALEYAGRLNLAELKQGTVESLPYADNTFDLVFCIEVIYHNWVRDKAKALAEFNRVLKPGGILIIREPAFNWLRSHHDTLFESSHRFTRRELAKKLAAVGFVVREKTYINTLLFPLVLVKRLFEKKTYPAMEMFPKNPVFNFFYYILVLESYLLRLLSLPFGLSVVCVGQKKG